MRLSRTVLSSAVLRGALMWCAFMWRLSRLICQYQRQCARASEALHLLKGAVWDQSVNRMTTYRDVSKLRGSNIAISPKLIDGLFTCAK